PPETLPLARGDTITVAHLLKSRARRLDPTPQRSLTRTEHIERVGSIRDVPSPIQSDSDDDSRPRYSRRLRASRPPRLPMHTLSVDSESGFGETLEYYSAVPGVDFTASEYSEGTVSASSYETVTQRRR